MSTNTFTPGNLLLRPSGDGLLLRASGDRIGLRGTPGAWSVALDAPARVQVRTGTTVIVQAVQVTGASVGVSVGTATAVAGDFTAITVAARIDVAVGAAAATPSRSVDVAVSG